jgi:predicted lipid-binding transport protein (Tim44 family)
MKRIVALSSVIIMLLTLCVWTFDAEARPGGGKSMGSRGSRSGSPPADQTLQPSAPTQQAVPPSAVQQPMPQRSGWMSGLMGGITGLLIGGAIGSLLFGGLGSGLFGGIGLLEILLVGGLLYFAFVYLRRRQHPTLASPAGYAPASETAGPTWQSESRYTPVATLRTSDGETDLERGVRHLRQMDPTFDPEHVADTASDVFFTVQAAWTKGDLSATRDLLTSEMYDTLQRECDQLRKDQRINRLENIAVRSVQVTEAWQESGQDFVTVRIRASLVDYTVDARSQEVITGSTTVPVTFQEYWTFVRPVGSNPWKLSAIQQAA